MKCRRDYSFAIFMSVLFAFASTIVCSSNVEDERDEQIMRELRDMLDARIHNEARVDEITAELKVELSERLERAKTKEGKDRLFWNFEKDYAKRKNIASEHLKTTEYRRALWTLFKADLESQAVTLIGLTLEEKRSQLVSAQNQSLLGSEVEVLIGMELALVMRTLKNHNAYCRGVLTTLARLSNAIVETYANKP